MRNRAKDITITELNRELMVLKTNGFPEGQLSTSYSSIVKGKKNNELENVILAKVAKQIKDKESKQKNITIIGIKEADNTLSSEEKTNEDKQKVFPNKLNASVASVYRFRGWAKCFPLLSGVLFTS